MLFYDTNIGEQFAQYGYRYNLFYSNFYDCNSIEAERSEDA